MNKLLWVDLEMTGLNAEKEVIIEVAAIVTDLNFKEFGHFETVVNQPQVYLDAMDDWNREHHSASGLLAKIHTGMPPSETEAQLIQLVRSHFPDPKDRPVLAGNSIAQDRLFIDRYFKKLSALLHYRMLDVTAWKVIFLEKFQKEFKKKNHHRSLDDIRESIAELQYYMKFIQVPPGAETETSHLIK